MDQSHAGRDNRSMIPPSSEQNETLESLAAERQRFHEVLDMLPVYVVLLTPDYHVPFANRFFEERFGKSEGRRCYEYLFERTEPCENCQTYEVLKTNAPQRWEWTGPDGRTYDISDFLFTDEDGSPLILEMGIDITERKRTEAELEKYHHHLEELVQQRAAQLEAAKAQLQTVFDIVNVGMLLIDEHGDVQRINDTVSRWVGRNISIGGHNQPGDMIGCLHALSYPAGCGLTPHCSACALRGALESVLHTGQPVHDVEMEVTFAGDGIETHLWMEISADPVDLDGKRHVILAMNNATARKQAEAAVERLATFPTLDPNPIVELDLEGHIHYINPSAESLFPNLQQMGSAHPWLADWKSATLALKKDENSYSVHEVRVGEKWYQQTVHYVEAIGRVRFYGSDITTRKQAEEALRESQRDLNRAQAVARTGSWRLDVQRNELLWSDENHRIFGIPAGTPLTYETFLAAVHPNDREQVDRKWAAAILGEPYDIEHRIMVDGDIRWVRERAELEFDDRGTLAGGFGTTQDITDKKQAEEMLRRTTEKLARSNEELVQFAYIASHDLQEPLRVISGYVQLLERKYKDRLDADADVFLHYIVDGAARMQQLITDLLNYSRVGTRGAALRPTEAQVVLDRALANLKTVITETGTMVTHDALPSIQGDETQLVQLFQNLIGNGIKFRGAQPPRIHVSAHRNSDHWEFAVRDNGIGVEPQYWDQIFVIFQRLHTRQKYPGTGIGLSICKRIVERHGGRIWLDSQPGQGTTFFFTLR